MATKPNTTQAAPEPQHRDRRVSRWTCHCEDPPVLLATYDELGRVNIKVRDRYWHVQGRVQAICPKCGQEHVLDG